MNEHVDECALSEGGPGDRTLSPTRVAVVPDGGVEALLVAVELEGPEPLVFHSLPGDDVDGRLVMPATGTVGVVPFVRC